MIEAIEVLLKHWGDQLAQNGLGGGLPSTMGTIVEFAGCAPRGGVYGARLLVAGAGPDYAAAEVSQVLFDLAGPDTAAVAHAQAGLFLPAVLAALSSTEPGAKLFALALQRYWNATGLDRDQQLYVLGFEVSASGRRAYHRAVLKLHGRVEAGLQARQQKLEAMRRESRRAGERLRKASSTQANAAHRGRGREFEEAQGGQGAIAAHKAHKAAAKAAQTDRSSGDSAS